MNSIRLPKLFAIFGLSLLFSCGVIKQKAIIEDGFFHLTILHVNDVYEIAPLDSGKVGGLARVATLKQQLLKQNPNTIAVMSGDFLSPSVFNNIEFEGQKVAGLQMVAAMNAAGIDAVCFGNHEFDNKRENLQRAIDASKFVWITGNVFERNGPDSSAWRQRGSALPQSLSLQLMDADSTLLNLAFFGTCITKVKRDYLAYQPTNTYAQQAVATLSSAHDLVLGLTHQDVSEDLILAESLNKTKCMLLMGGHDHERSFNQVGSVSVAKADANARTAYVHEIIVNKKTGQARLYSNVVHLNEQIPLEPRTDSLVQRWMTKAEQNLIEKGYDPFKVVYKAEEILDARESVVRRGQCVLGTMITAAMQKAAQKPTDCAFFNSGSVRIDDQLTGSIRQWDVFRILPFGGPLAEADVKGSLLIKLFDQGEASVGKGAYLQRSKVDKVGGQWQIGGSNIDPEKKYHIITSMFLLEGKEFGMEYFTASHPDVSGLQMAQPNNFKDPRSDIQRSFIAYLGQL